MQQYSKFKTIRDHKIYRYGGITSVSIFKFNLNLPFNKKKNYNEKKTLLQN